MQNQIDLTSPPEGNCRGYNSVAEAGSWLFLALKIGGVYNWEELVTEENNINFGGGS